MKPKASRSKTILTKLVAVVILALLVVAAVKCANGASLANTAWSLLPPVIAIVLALITKEAYSALFITAFWSAACSPAALRPSRRSTPS